MKQSHKMLLTQLEGKLERLAHLEDLVLKANYAVSRLTLLVDSLNHELTGAPYEHDSASFNLPHLKPSSISSHVLLLRYFVTNLRKLTIDAKPAEQPATDAKRFGHGNDRQGQRRARERAGD